MAARSALDEMDDKGEFKRKDSTYRDFVKKGSKFEPAGMCSKMYAAWCMKLHDEVMTVRAALHIAFSHRLCEGAVQVWMMRLCIITCLAGCLQHCWCQRSSCQGERWPQLSLNELSSP